MARPSVWFCVVFILVAPVIGAEAPVKPKDTEAKPDSTDLALTQPTPYKPNLKRDPFMVPSDSEKSGRGDLLDDLGVKGRIVSHGKILLVATDSRGNIKTLPVGHKFRDGEIIAITERSVTFHQWDVNSTNRSSYRTIVKLFKPEEGKP